MLYVPFSSLFIGRATFGRNEKGRVIVLSDIYYRMRAHTSQ